MIFIRADGNGEIGSGHIVRCAAIARVLVSLGHESLFVVSDARSAEVVQAAGFEAIVLSGDAMSLRSDDGLRLAKLAKEENADGVLVDSYGVSDEFFESIREDFCNVAYIDDAYTFADGFRDSPRCWNVGSVVNYSFGFSEEDYQVAYAGKRTRLLIGPSYAPIRSEFTRAEKVVSEKVERILVTSGSTNPVESLERMVLGCLDAFPKAHIDVVVGGMARFDSLPFVGYDVLEHRGVSDLSALMRSADLAVSAAGSTLYELCCVGVPTVALPIVENQMGNARGFARMGIGPSFSELDWTSADISSAVVSIAHWKIRNKLRCKMIDAVDGRGARRIASSILAP